MQLSAKRPDLRAISDDVSSPRIDADEACLRAFQDQLDYIHRTLLRLGADLSDVEDLVQDVFMALRGAWQRCDKSRPLRPYLFGIAFRIVAAHRRKRNREVPLGLVDVPDAQVDFDASVRTMQARRLILAALDRVPLPRRAVLIMYELDDIPVAEIASALKIPLFTIYGRLRKGRRELAAAVRRLTR